MSDKKITALQLRDDVDDDISLPVDDGIQTYRVTAPQFKDYILPALGLGLPKLNTNTFDVRSIINAGIASSVGSNALTVAFKDSTGADASATSPVKIGFRSATLTTGVPVFVSLAAALNIVVPSGATMGMSSAIAGYLYIYAINNAGAIEGAISGRGDFDEGGVVSTTALSSGSDAGDVLYSTSARTGVAIRLIGRILITESTAGTWATAASEISMVPFLNFTISSWTAFSPSLPSGWGTVTNQSFFYKRVGDSLQVRGVWKNGTVGASLGYIPLPSGLLIDASKISANSLYEHAGIISQTSAGSNIVEFDSGLSTLLSIDTGNLDKVYICDSGTGSDGLIQVNVDTTFTTGNTMACNFSVPIDGWS